MRHFHLILRSFTCLVAGLFFVQVQGQSIRTIQQGQAPDSSYYDIARIDANEFWVGGENGILKCLDTLGNVTNLALPLRGRHILKIVSDGRYVFVAADQGTIFRYDRSRDTWIYSDYGKKGFEKLTFYDMELLNNGTIVVAGGHNRVAKGQVAVPRGFIARIDYDLLTEPEIVWSHALMFGFSLEYDAAKNEIFATAFNGVNSQLFSSIDDAQTFQRQGTMPGLVHQLMLHEGEMWYSGAKNVRYANTGIAGKVGKKPMELEGEGCIWSLLPIAGEMYCLAYNGAIVATEPGFTDYDYKIRPAKTSLYEAVAISSKKAFIIGHDRTILLMEIEQASAGVSLQYEGQ